MYTCDVTFGIMYLSKEDSQFHYFNDTRECALESIGCSEYWGSYGSDGYEVDTDWVKNEIDQAYNQLEKNQCLPICWWIDDDKEYYNDFNDVSNFLGKNVCESEFQNMEDNAIDDGGW